MLAVRDSISSGAFAVADAVLHKNTASQMRSSEIAQ
jgi:hypothetical protein